jgi:tetratricopeptide (TPR) repeat protein
LLLAAGDSATAAEAEAFRGEDIWLRGRRDESFEMLGNAAAMVADQATSRSKATVTSLLSRFHMLAGNVDDAVRFGTEVLEMLEELGGDDTLRSQALNNIGVARIASGDFAGMQDLEESVAIAVAVNSSESVRGYGNLASVLTDLGELDRAYEMIEKGYVLAERFAMWEASRWLKAELLWASYQAGRWDEAAEALDELVAEFEANEFWMESSCRWLRGRIRLARGDLESAQADAEQALERSRVGKDPQVVWPALAFSARAFWSTDPGLANELVSELLSEWKQQQFLNSGHGDWLPDGVEVLRHLGRQGELLELGAEQSTSTPWLKAALAYAAGDFSAAADIYGAIGSLPNEAQARLRAAEAFVAEGRRAEADAELKSALAFWRSVGATPYVREGEALLAESA